MEENFRVQCFRQLLQTFKPGDTEAPVLLGELMYQASLCHVTLHNLK